MDNLFISSDQKVSKANIFAVVKKNSKSPDGLFQQVLDGIDQDETKLAENLAQAVGAILQNALLQFPDEEIGVLTGPAGQPEAEVLPVQEKEQPDPLFGGQALKEQTRLEISDLSAQQKEQAFTAGMSLSEQTPYALKTEGFAPTGTAGVEKTQPEAEFKLEPVDVVDQPAAQKMHLAVQTKTGETPAGRADIKTAGQSKVSPLREQIVKITDEQRDWMAVAKQPLSQQTSLISEPEIKSVHDEIPISNLDKTDVVSRLIDSIQYSGAERKQMMVVQLKPDYLGRLQIQLDQTDGQLSLSIRAENKQVFHRLELEKTKIIESLTAKGLGATRVQIVLEPEFKVAVEPGQAGLSTFQDEQTGRDLAKDRPPAFLPAIEKGNEEQLKPAAGYGLAKNQPYKLLDQRA